MKLSNNRNDHMSIKYSNDGCSIKTDNDNNNM